MVTIPERNQPVSLRMSWVDDRGLHRRWRCSPIPVAAAEPMSRKDRPAGPTIPPASDRRLPREHVKKLDDVVTELAAKGGPPTGRLSCGDSPGGARRDGAAPAVQKKNF